MSKENPKGGISTMTSDSNAGQQAQQNSTDAGAQDGRAIQLKSFKELIHPTKQANQSELEANNTQHPANSTKHISTTTRTESLQTAADGKIHGNQASTAMIKEAEHRPAPKQHHKEIGRPPPQAQRHNTQSPRDSKQLLIAKPCRIRQASLKGVVHNMGIQTPNNHHISNQTRGSNMHHHTAPAATEATQESIPRPEAGRTHLATQQSTVPATRPEAGRPAIQHALSQHPSTTIPKRPG